MDVMCSTVQHSSTSQHLSRLDLGSRAELHDTKETHAEGDGIERWPNAAFSDTHATKNHEHCFQQTNLLGSA